METKLCPRKDGSYYMKNGLDEYIVDNVTTKHNKLEKLHIPITTFMIANDPYLQNL
jgi:uncharacterized protein with von Willebrand factor type A (vWA) domain